MGNEQGSCQAEFFKIQDWQLTDRYENYSVWRNRRDHSQRIQEYSIYTSNDEEHRYEEQMYNFRKYHPNIVATYYLDSSSQSQFCSSSHAHKLFIQKIPIRLSDIEHIPFPDFLHIYAQALRGFQALSNYSGIGFFSVEEEYIGINDKGIVKVWMNQNYSKNYYIGSKVSEEFMVNSIIQIIEKNIDHNRIPRHVPSVRNFLYRNNDKLKFEQANKQFENYLIQYHLGSVPAKLQCIDQVGGISAIQNRDKEGNKNKTFMEPLQFNRNRPQLVDSQLLRNQFPILTPRIQTSPYYYEGGNVERGMSLGNSQVVPTTQNKILAPAIVRQNTPIVRKPTPSYYQPVNEFNFNPQLTQVNKIESNKSSAARIEQRPVFTKPNINNPVLPYRPIIAPVHQVSQSQTIYRPLVIQRPNLRVKQQHEVINQSFIDLVQPEKNIHFQKYIAIQQNFKSSNTIYSHQDISQKNIPSPNSYQIDQPRSAASSFSREPQKRPNSSYLKFNKETVIHPIKRSFDDESVSNKPKTVEVSQWQQKMNQFANKYTNSKAQETQAYRQKDWKDANNTASGNSVAIRQNNKSINIKQSQYTTIDIDDGKSSIDFLKKLKQFKNFNADTNQPEINHSSPYGYNTFGEKTGLNSNLLTKQANSVQNLHSAQDFGRNAVSNIIPTQSGILNQPKVFDNTPLKFQNNLDMKYSMFKDDSPSPQASYGLGYTSKNYQANFDADIYADLNNMRRNL